jgi:hypothetical protein
MHIETLKDVGVKAMWAISSNGQQRYVLPKIKFDDYEGGVREREVVAQGTDSKSCTFAFSYEVLSNFSVKHIENCRHLSVRIFTSLRFNFFL